MIRSPAAPALVSLFLVLTACRGEPAGDPFGPDPGDQTGLAAAEPPTPPGPPPLALPEIPDGGLSAAELHRRAVVVDLHADTLWQLWRGTQPGGEPQLPLQASPDLLAQGGVDAQLYPIFVWPDQESPHEVAFQVLEVWRRDLLGAHDGVELARSAADVVRLAGEGKRAALLAMEGAKPLDGVPEDLDDFVDAGLTYLSLTWNEANSFGDGIREARHGGATAEGLALVAQLNERGVIPDISHAAQGTFWDVVTASQRPVIASHSNALAVTDHPRNLDDAQLWALADAGGVAGINFHARFLTRSAGGATVDDLLAHVAHLRAVMGPGHVALGSDFDGQIIEPAGLPHAGVASLAITEALMGAGYDHAEVAGILGHDFLRVLHETREGEARPRVIHRPASILDLSTSRAGATAGLLRDRDTTTPWAVPGGGDPVGATVTLRVAGLGVDRVSLAADGPGSESAVSRVKVSVRSEADLYEHAVDVELLDGPRPTRVELPGAGCFDELIITVEISVVDGSDAPAALSEILPERRAIADCP